MEENFNTPGSNFQEQIFDWNPRTSVLGSCYVVDASTTLLSGFHYCATSQAGKLLSGILLRSSEGLFLISLNSQEPSGIPEVPSGSKPPPQSPPIKFATALAAENFWPERTRLEFGGEEAAQTITGECERLFCDTLCAIFLGERNLALQQSLVMGAISKKKKLNSTEQQRGGIQNWVQVWDYSADAIYRGFVAGSDEQKGFFVFFENNAPGQGLKSGLVSPSPLPFTNMYQRTPHRIPTNWSEG
jgi:hypothetical protein